MSDPTIETQSDGPMTSELPGSVGPGALIRAARESQGLHIGALAVSMKVPVKKLEALESDRFDLLPDTVFTRALALSVCRALKIDASPIMRGLPQLKTPQIKTDESGLNASFRGASDGMHGGIISHLASPVGAGVLLLILTIAAVWFWPVKTTDEFFASSQEKAKSQEMAPGSGRDVAATPQLLDPPTPETTAAPVVVASVATSAAMAVGSQAPQAVVSTVPPSGTSTEVSAGTDAAVLVLTAKGASWVDVTDAKGKSQLRKTTSDGEVFHISGPLPLAVIVGKADVVSVSIRGQALDLKAVSKDNVARFEVK